LKIKKEIKVKKLTAVVLFVLFVVPVFAAEEEKENTVDLQLWSRTTSEGTEIFPWMMFYGKNGLVLDFRHNYDVHNTAGFFIGRQFGGDKFYVIPEIGYLAGEFSGLSPEFYLGAGVGKVSYFSQWQWAQSSKHDLNSWAYQYQELLVKAGKISFGAGSQTCWEKNTAPVNTDIGPMIKVELGKDWSTRLWWAKRTFGADRGDWIMYVAIGKVFKWK
jgi:hypothetical protein